MRRVAFVWDEVLATYRFHSEHPLNPRRLELTVDLIRRLGLIGDDAHPVLMPRSATESELLRVHAPEYIAAVKRVSESGVADAAAAAFGLGSADVPVVRGMHEASLHIAGATLVAAEAVMDGRVTRAFNIAGGLHHAKRAEAAGFCVYNDLAVAIAWLRQEHDVRVMYIDIDAHHGDGVQDLFWEDAGVLTVSFHESGAFLFPGGGNVDEVGAGDAHGTSINVPLAPFTEDDSYYRAFMDIVPDAAAAFRPDVLVMQCGCDAHARDPLTDLRCTTSLFERLVRGAGEVADRQCGGRIVATGGGGYAIHDVVPRAWTLVWAALCDIDVADAIPADWVKAVRLESGADVTTTLRDAPDPFGPAPRRAVVEAINERTVRDVRQRVLPLLTGWGLAF